MRIELPKPTYETEWTSVWKTSTGEVVLHEDGEVASVSTDRNQEQAKEYALAMLAAAERRKDMELKIDSKRFVDMVEAVPFDEQNMLFKNHPDESHSWRESGAQRIASDINSDDDVDVYNLLRERSREVVANIVNAVERAKSVKIDSPYRMYAEESLMNCYTNVLFRLLSSHQ